MKYGAQLSTTHAAGKTIMTSTHDLHIVEEISDEVYVFSYDKQIVKSGLPGDILKDEQLLRDHNLIHVHRHRHDNRRSCYHQPVKLTVKTSVPGRTGVPACCIIPYCHCGHNG